MIRLLYCVKLIALLLLSASCCEEYSLNGNTGGFFDGTRAYLKTEKDGVWSVVDSCDILHGKFRMNGPVHSPFVSALFIGDEAVMPVVVERGSIDVKIDLKDAMVSGTHLNNLLSDFMRKKGEYELRMAEMERSEARLILDGHTAESAAAYMRDSLMAVGRELDEYVEGFIAQQYNTVLGPCVFKLLCGTLPYPFKTKQIDRILDAAPEVFLNDSFVKQFIAAAEENKQRMMAESEEE